MKKSIKKIKKLSVDQMKKVKGGNNQPIWV